MKIFHHNDADGRCAAAIILNKFSAVAQNIKLYEMDYNKSVPVNDIDENEVIYIVDFSFKPDVMKEVRKKTNTIYWIDHHASCKDYDYQDLPGLRDYTVKGKSGCELTWEFIFPNEPMPKAVKLIGDYDAWRLNEKDVFAFYEGLKLLDTNPRSEVWMGLIDQKTIDENWDLMKWDITTDIINNGKACIMYRNAYCNDIINSYGYKSIDFYNSKEIALFVCNIYRFGSQGFGQKMQEYDVCVSYIYNGHDYIVSLYSEKENINVGEIAKEYGGGGHKGAAGFVCRTLPFTKES